MAENKMQKPRKLKPGERLRIPVHARDHDRRRATRSSRSRSTTSATRSARRSSPTSTDRSRRGQPRDGHRADDSVPRSRTSPTATETLASISTHVLRQRASTPTMLAKLQLPRQDVAREGRPDRRPDLHVRVRERSCRRSTPKAQARDEQRRDAIALAQTALPPRTRAWLQGDFARCRRTRSRRSPTKLTTSTPTPRSRSACCSARRTSRSTTPPLAVAAFDSACSRASRARAAQPYHDSPKVLEAWKQGRSAAVAAAVVLAARASRAAAASDRRGRRSASGRPRRGARAPPITRRAPWRCAAARYSRAARRRDRRQSARMNSGRIAGDASADAASRSAWSPMPAAQRPRRSRHSAGCARKLDDGSADLVLALGGMGTTQAELEATLGALADKRAGRSSRCPAISRPRPRIARRDRGAAQAGATSCRRPAGRAGSSARGATIATIPGATGATERLVAGRGRLRVAGSAMSRCVYTELAGDHRGTHRARGRGPPREGAATGELALVPHRPIDVVVHGAGALTPARVRAAATARTPRSRPGPRTRRLGCPRHAHPAAGLLVIRGTTWTWKPLVDER